MSIFPGSQDPFAPAEVESRTSIMAVASIVCSLICCIPILTGMLGAFLGVVALFLIGSSHGRLKGRGLAFGGVVLGLLTSMLWIGVMLGAVRALGNYVNTGTAAFESIDAGDFAQSRAAFVPTTDQSVSDEQIATFGQMIRDDYGGFVAGPHSLMEYWTGKSSPAQSSGVPAFNFGDMPIAIEYENDFMFAIMRMPDGSSQPPPGRFIRDLGYQRPDGTTVWLSEIETDAPDAPDTPPDTPDTPEEPGGSDEPGGEGGG